MVTGENGTATIYQPQVISWPERKTLNARIAIGVTPTGAKAPILGVIEVAFATQTELAERTVVLTDPQARVVALSVGDAAQAAQFEARIKTRARQSCRRSAFRWRRVVMSLREQADKPPEVALDNTPPRIFVSARPGEPRRVRRRAGARADRRIRRCRSP